MNQIFAFTVAITALFLLAGCPTNPKPAPPTPTSSQAQALSAKPPQVRPNTKPKPAHITQLENQRAAKHNRTRKQREYKAWRKQKRLQNRTKRQQRALILKQRADLLGQRLRQQKLTRSKR